MKPIRVGMTNGDVNEVLGELFDRVASDYGVLLLDPELRIAVWTEGAANLFGYRAEEVVGRPAELIFTPEDRAQGIAEHEATIACASGRAHDDRWHLRKDGVPFWASGMLVALRNGDDEVAGYAKILRDRTDLRIQIDTLVNRLDEGIEEQERRKVMLATLAHELRNPLAPLANAAQLIRLADGEETKSRLAYPLQIIERQIAFLQRLIDDLLDITRIGVGKLALATQRFVLQEALEEALHGIEAEARARQHTVVPVLPQVPVEIEADRDRVVQIVVNLLNNAVRYTPPGGCVWLKATTETTYAVMRVEDNGQGIPPELQLRIFDLFTQGVPATGRAAGLGIGLALVKELVAAHGGTVAVRSEGVGRGSEFTVRLPLRAAAV